MYFKDSSEVILGFNNLQNSASKSFGEADVAALSFALEMTIGGSILCKTQGVVNICK